MTRIFFLQLMMIMLAGSTVAKADEPTGKKPASTEAAAEAAKAPRVLVTISKETTFITGPLRPDGYVDYIEALNLRCSEGVTPENNAAVSFWQAIGPEPVPQEMREEFFRRLGMKAPPEKGEYFITFGQYLRKADATKEPPKSSTDAPKMYELRLRQQDVAIARPWSAVEFPDVAAWLAASERPLALVVSGSKLSRCYDPTVIGRDGTLVWFDAHSQSERREIARALVARAMLRLNAGKLDEAWEDLLACHRFARLEAQGWTLVEGLIAIKMETIACDGDVSLLQNVQITKSQAAKFRNDLASLAPMPKMVGKIETGERFSSLDMTCTLAREGLSSLWKLTEEHEPLKKRPQLVKKEFIDWNLIVRESNAWYDQVVHALQQPNRRERFEHLDALEDDLKCHIAEQRRFFLSSMWENPQQGFSRFMSMAINGMLLPAITSVHDYEDRATMRFKLTRLAFALAEHRADHDSYPKKLDDLVPKYLPAIPRDLFNDGELHYERKVAGYILYSVGVNGEDDGGSENESQSHDDLAIRVPAAKKLEGAAP